MTITEMALTDLEVILPEIWNTLSQTILTSDIIGEICKILAYDVIFYICTTWVNDINTTIGMECLWEEFLVNDIILNPLSKKYIIEALNITDTIDFTMIEVKHKKYCEQDIFITIEDNNLIISTEYRILYNYLYR